MSGRTVQGIGNRIILLHLCQRWIVISSNTNMRPSTTAAWGDCQDRTVGASAFLAQTSVTGSYSNTALLAVQARGEPAIT